MIHVTVEIFKIVNIFTGLDEKEEPVFIEKPELSVTSQWSFNDPEDAFEFWTKSLIDKPLCPTFDKGYLSLITVEPTEDGIICEFLSGVMKYVITVTGWNSWNTSVQRRYHVSETIIEEYHEEFGIQTKKTMEYWFNDEEKFKNKVLKLCPDYEWEFDGSVSYPFTYATQRGIRADYEFSYGKQH